MTIGHARRAPRPLTVAGTFPRFLAIAALLGAVAAAGCKDSTASPRLLQVTDTQLADMIASVSDARVRLAPSLQQTTTGSSLAAALGTLGTALAAKQVAGIATALTAAELVLSSSAATAPAADAPDRDAVSVALAIIHAAVTLSQP
ncbi:MAG: hypothetical protein M3081_08755 [Gemmatimonadota bacterium]|nr:hypothetical protein [Gemmatimonadota bacterium]